MAANKNVYIDLSDGNKIPALGLGTWKSKEGEVKKAVKAAIQFGYRHIDCAYSYMNEDEVGEAIQEKIKDGTVKRDDLLITTKLWGTFHNPDKVEHALRLSLAKLQVDRVDLFLMHSPMALGYVSDTDNFPKNDDGTSKLDTVHYVDTWKAMEKLVEKGLTKSIGVSNFNVKQLGEIIAAAKVPCVMNQIENHPCLDQSELINFCKTNKVAITAYSPLGSPDRTWASAKDPNLRENSLVKEIADNKGCTPVQVLLAYHLCQGLACLAKSVTPSRIEQNFASLDVKLSTDDIKKLDTLECNHRAVPFQFWDTHVNYPFKK